MSQVWRSTIPYESERIHAAAIYCSDGRFNEQFDEFLHTRLALPRYDRLVLPGGPAALAGYLASWCDEDALVQQLTFLIESHELDRLVLIAHEGCGFYLKRLAVPRDEVHDRQLADLVKAADRIRRISARVSIEAYLAKPRDRLVSIQEVSV